MIFEMQFIQILLLLMGLAEFIRN